MSSVSSLFVLIAITAISFAQKYSLSTSTSRSLKKGHRNLHPTREQCLLPEVGAGKIFVLEPGYAGLEAKTQSKTSDT